MGESETVEADLEPNIIARVSEHSSAQDTKDAASRLAELEVDLLLFVGGDGTARDILDAIDGRVPVVGVPAGVKMHSAVFAVTPQQAGRVAIEYLVNGLPTREAEVMDVDEEAYRQGRLSAKLYGYIRTPYLESMMQGVKTTSYGSDEDEQQKSIAKYIDEAMQHDILYILGPGTTVRAISKYLKLEKTLLGVDVIRNKTLLMKDANENQILDLLSSKAKIIITPIGGQAYVFGRGNQQISPTVIRKVGKDNIVIVATKNKIQNLARRRLLVDTGDPSLDLFLRGYVRVITDYREETVLFLG